MKPSSTGASFKMHGIGNLWCSCSILLDSKRSPHLSQVCSLKCRLLRCSLGAVLQVSGVFSNSSHGKKLTSSCSFRRSQVQRRFSMLKTSLETISCTGMRSLACRAYFVWPWAPHRLELHRSRQSHRPSARVSCLFLSHFDSAMAQMELTSARRGHFLLKRSPHADEVLLCQV